MDSCVFISGTYFVKAHGTEFVYFARVFGTRNGRAGINMRPEPSGLFEHLRILFILKESKYKVLHKHHRVTFFPLLIGSFH